MNEATTKILAALAAIEERIRTTHPERLEASAWSLYQHVEPDVDQEPATHFQQFEEDWATGDLWPFVVSKWLESLYASDTAGRPAP